MAKPKVYLIYDGECPLCSASANALKIREAVGELVLANAREDHPLVQEVKQAGLDLNKGMVVKINEAYYHGAEAQHVLAQIGTTDDWFNRTNVWLFQYKWLAFILYPIMRSVRNIVLKFKGIKQI